MNFQFVLIFFLFILSWLKEASGFLTGCKLINITCSEIREASGFNFTYECPEQSELEIQDINKISIAHFHSARSISNISPEVVKIDETSIVMKSCRGLAVKCFISKGFVEEKSVCFKVIEEDPDLPSHLLWGPKQKETIIICAVAAIVIGIAFLALYGSFACWKRNQKKQQKSGSVTTFLKHAVTCSCFKRKDSPEARTQNGSGFQLVSTEEIENQINNDIRNGSVLSQSGENDPSEIVCSGDTKAPDITSHSHHRPMNRKLRDDPGGENGTETINLIREGDGGQTAGNQKAEDSVTERQQLLSDRRAVDTGLDMTGGAEALVNKAGFDHVSRCSGALVIDVESENKEEPK